MMQGKHVLSAAKNPIRQWLIGGPGRCGKSTLAEAIARSQSPVSAMQVDALLNANLRLGSPGSVQGGKEFLRNYLTRPRYMNPERTQTRCPLDDFPQDIDQVIETVTVAANMSRVQLIASALNGLAKSTRKSGWIALDLHPEFYFRSYLAQIPELRLLVLLRDPLEAIAASLYWQTYPMRRAGKSQFEYFTTLWKLSAVASMALRRAFPAKVSLYSSNALVAGEAHLCDDLGGAQATARFATAYGGRPFFTARCSGKTIEFLCPDGKWQQLLSDEEVCVIERFRRSIWAPMLFTSMPSASVPLAGPFIDQLALRLADQHPAMSKTLVEFGYFPIRSIRRQLLYVKGRLTTIQ